MVQGFPKKVSEYPKSAEVPGRFQSTSRGCAKIPENRNNWKIYYGKLKVYIVSTFVLSWSP